MIEFSLLEKISGALKKYDIGYIIIGGQAVLLYGEARFTDDIDILLDADVSMLNIINDLVINYGFERLSDDEFTRKTFVAPIYDKESDFRIDLIFSFSDYEKEAFSRAVTKRINDTDVRYASLEDMIIMKLYSGRAIDIEDLKKILLKNKNYDVDYLMKWLTKFDEDPESNLTEKFKDIIESIK